MLNPRQILVITLSLAAATHLRAQDDAPVPQPTLRVVKFLGERAAETLSGATRVEVFRVSSKRAEADEPDVGGYKIVAAGEEQGKPFARRLVGVLLDQNTYRFDSNKVGGFTPLVGMRLWRGEEAVEVLLSFSTDELVVLSPDPKDKSTRSAQEDFDSARPVLVELSKEALPDDAEVQALAIQPGQAR